MAIKLNQSLKQSQSLMMTPQLQQAIKLLTLTHLEMTNAIAEEMVDNPVLEEVQIDSSNETQGEDYGLESLEIQSKEATVENFEDKPIMSKEGDDFDWQSYIETYNNTSSSAPPNMATVDLDDLPNYENIISKGKTLAEHLEWQLSMEVNLSDEEKKLAEEIIHNINDDGYLSLNYNEIITNFELEREVCDDILEMVKRFDPVGCGSENLTDCLLAQAVIAEERSPLLEKIIRHHLNDLQGKNYPKIAKALGVSSEQVRDTALLLHNFHPKPGRLISSGDVHYIIPDIYVVEVGGEFVVQVNEEGVPRLKVSNLYQQLLNRKDSKEDAEASEYIQEKLRSALFLIKSIQHRKRTIVRVSEAIVKQQQEFFKKGPKYLKPMILKNISDEIGMHESTVSRVTTNKYMHTPIGMFELKYFFNSGVGSKQGGADISSEVLKLKIKDLIKNENPAKPLSDQKLVDLLSTDDVKIARRTVAKYREMMNILSSSKRKVKM